MQKRSRIGWSIIKKGSFLTGIAGIGYYILTDLRSENSVLKGLFRKIVNTKNFYTDNDDYQKIINDKKNILKSKGDKI